MRSRTACICALLFTLTLLGGCQGVLLPQGSSNNKGKLEGTSWDSEPGWIKKVIYISRGGSKLTFYGDLTFSWSIGNMKFTGKYAYGPGDYVYLTLNEELEGQREFQERVILLGDKLTMADEDGTALTFTRRHATPNSSSQAAGMRGKWTYSEATYDGQPMIPNDPADCLFVFTNETIVFKINNQVLQEATYHTDFSHQPAHIDITYNKGERKGKKVMGLLKVSDKTIEITLADPDQPRPKEFTATPGSKRERLVLQKVQ